MKSLQLFLIRLWGLPRLLPLPARMLPVGLVAVIACVVSASTCIADDWEWDPTHGYHEEEWYDPSDWFDADDGIDYEYDDYYYYDDDDYYDDDYYDADDRWYGDNYYTNDWYDDEPDYDLWYGTPYW